MIMKRAREILHSVAPENFKISLSSCYNYTKNYQKGSRQAIQHHAGREINALLSLRNLLVLECINLHWSTANVNLIIDTCHNLANSVTISKDAKAIRYFSNACSRMIGETR